MSRRAIGLGALAIGGLAVWIYYQNRQAAAAAQAALAATSPATDTNNSVAQAAGDLTDGAGSFG